MRECLLNPNKPNRRLFTEAARIGAMEARRRKREGRAAIGCDHPEVFVVRGSQVPLPFFWEIRRFGGIVLHRSEDGYSKVAEARTAGRRAAARLVGAVP